MRSIIIIRSLPKFLLFLYIFIIQIKNEISGLVSEGNGGEELRYFIRSSNAIEKYDVVEVLFERV